MFSTLQQTNPISLATFDFLSASALHTLESEISSSAKDLKGTLYQNIIYVYFIIVIMKITIITSQLQAYYSQRPEDRDLSPVEIAIKNFLEQSTENADRGSMEFRSSIRNLLNSGTSNIGVVESLRVELGRFITFDRSDRELYVFHPRTLKAFVVEKSDEEAYQLDCIWFKLLFHFLPRRDSD